MNTINLFSAISVLACNVSMATIPKQANSNTSSSNYGDIVVIKRDIDYNTSNSLQSFNNDKSITYNVSRQIGSYSDERINFYTERYIFNSYWTDDAELIRIGFVYFFTLDIYNSTLLSNFQFKQNLSSSTNPTLNGDYHYQYYNFPLSLTNLSNTLYFQNYNLGWDNNTNLPKVASANTSYLPLSTSGGYADVSGTATSIFHWGDLSFNNSNNQHGSINYSHVHYFDSKSPVNDGVVGFNPNGAYLTYKYYVNNPTYEVIDLPNVMLSILTMPFTFFSQAFNLTLFPNTPYALNVGHTILIIVGVIGTIYLIKYLVGIFKG